MNDKLLNFRCVNYRDVTVVDIIGKMFLFCRKFNNTGNILLNKSCI